MPQETIRLALGEIDVPLDLVTALLKKHLLRALRVSPNGSRPPPTACPDREAGSAPQEEPAPGGDNPPPALATRQQTPPSVEDALPPGTMLGELCRRHHRYLGTRKSLRRASNGKCLQCLRAHERERKTPRPLPAPAPPSRGPVLVTSQPERPELPSHWEERGFLSPITCNDPRHRFRDTGYTLRYTDSELCVQCCTEANPAMVGD